ncbi:hypothetical protein NLG97_g5264 [Lecanicillium saksenae]|uniref:Uncharacterized protein n=1 Tax=Lecanicillium saksenae TaxID=468837 RepID=A0ACC1QSW9_9HYPO|nr:hypothetical protein NLG97_g5264 [Lecanicillium saksenae]
MDAPQLKRILDGRELAKALGVKPGKWTGQALDVCVAWQLRNPDKTDPTPAIEEVQKQRKELGDRKMNAEELLGSDNQSRLKLLAKDAIPAESVQNSLASEDASLRRDAALILLGRALEKAPVLENSTLIDALAKTLKAPSVQEGTDTFAAATAAEAVLAALYSFNAEAEIIQNDVLLNTIPYSQTSQAWTTQVAASVAERLLKRYLPGEKKQEFIIGDILQGYLRPIFSKSTSSVTAEGRPALFREPSPEGGFHAQKAAWKDAGLHVVAIFEWAVQSSEPATMKKHWPLYVPVLVTLTEDNDVAIRQRGIDILNVFLTKCPADILRTSGIDSVFQESIFPSLLFLPALTPEAESVTLLRSAYRTLLTLAVADSDPAGKKRRALLDKMLRDGVLAGYFHASQHIRVVEVLMQSVAQIVETLQIYTVKHLSSLLDLFTPVLTDAFALAYAPAVIAAAKALNIVILNCWPRVVGTPHAEQIINIVSRCWTNIHDADNGNANSDLNILAEELKQTMSLLASLWAESDEPLPKEKLASIVKEAPHLEPLFAPFQLGKSAA